MLSNNSARLGIAVKLKNIFDYEEFSKACDEAQLPLIHQYEYAQKIGILCCARTEFPEEQPETAYRMFLERHPYRPESIPDQRPILPSTPDTAETKCGSCGGGKIR